MKQINAIVATGHIDKQNEMLGPQALSGMANQANTAYIPLWIDHDISRPPIGRMVSAEVIHLEDEVLAVRATYEVWESPDDMESITSDGRQMVIHSTNTATFEVVYDVTFQDEEGMKIIDGFKALGASKIQYGAKKSSVVVPQLIIAAGAFLAGGIAVGFLNALGEDLYDGLKERLKKLRKMRDKEGVDRVSRIVLRFSVEVGSKLVEVNAVLDNATDEQIEKFFSDGIEQLDKITKQALAREPRTVRVTTRQTEEALEPIYAVRDDCKPLQLRFKDFEDN